MKKKILLTIASTIILVNLIAQDFISVDINKSYGGDYNDHIIEIIKSHTSSEYILLGNTNSKGNGGNDAWVIKVNSKGEIIWEKTYGKTQDDVANSIIASNDGGYFFCGNSKSIETGYINVWISKIDGYGKEIWSKTFWGSDNDNAHDILLTPDKGCIILASKESKADNDKEIWLIKIDKKGKRQWQSILGERYIDDEAYSFLNTPDGGYLLAGYTRKNDKTKEDIYIIKTDSRGTELWSKTFGGAEKDIAQSIKKTNDNRFVISGITYSKGMGKSDFIVLKIDANGTQLWEKTYGYNNSEQLTSSYISSKNEIFLLGNTNSKNAEEKNTYLVKMNKKGNPKWEKIINSKGESSATDIIEVSNNKYIIVGYSDKGIDEEKNADFIKIYDKSEEYLVNYTNDKYNDWNKKIPNESEQQFSNRINNYSTEEIKEKFQTEARSNLFIASNEPVKKENLYRGKGNPLEGLDISDVAKTITIGNYYALIVGVDSYSGDWYPLKNAVRDAKTVENLLKSKYKFDYFRTLYDDQATRSNIINQFEWLINNVKEEDNVFIYYSGHGEFKESLNKGFWVPIDATTNSMSAYISNSDIQTFLGGIRSKHTLLVSDACFSGDIFRGKTVLIPFEESERYYREISNLSSRKAITSGGIEPVMDGGKDGHSVFAYYFIKMLNTNQSPYFDAGQLYNRIKIPIINNSEQSPQFSPIKGTGDEGGQFIFIKK